LVFVGDFEVDPAQMPVIVVDEIGKMELFSHTFEQTIRQLMSRHDLTILATIPDKRKLPVALVDEIRRSSTVRLFEVRLLYSTSYARFLWSPYRLFFVFFSSPNLTRRRLDVCHTSTHGVALVQI